MLLETFKTIRHINAECLHGIFKTHVVPYELRTKNLVQPKRKSITYGMRSFSYLGARLWNNLAKDYPFLCDFYCTYCIFYCTFLHCIYFAPVYRILAYWIMLSVLNTTLNKDYSILFYILFYGNTDLGQHWLRLGLVAWWHQAITWTNIHLTSVRSFGIQLRAILQEMLKMYILNHVNTYLNINSRLQLHFPGDNELIFLDCILNNHTIDSSLPRPRWHSPKKQ